MLYQLVSSSDCYGIMSPERHQWDLALFTARNQPMEIIFQRSHILVMSDKIHTNLGCQFCLIVTLNWLLVGKLWIIELRFVIINIRHVCSGLRLYVNYIRKNNLKLPGDIFAATFQSKYWKYIWGLLYILSDNVLDKLLCLIILALNRSHQYRISCWNS